MPIEIYLVRHGESTWNAEGRYQGRKDPPLSTLGLAQAKALAKRLRDDPPAAIVTSPLRRAQVTAQIVAAEFNKSLRIDERLTEICHGDWEGLLRDEVQRRWPQLVGQWRANPESVNFPGGESLAEVQARWREFLADIASDSPLPLLVVTHDVIVRLAVLDARQQTLADFNSIRIDNAAINEFNYDGRQLKLLRLSDLAHLGALRADASAQAL